MERGAPSAGSPDPVGDRRGGARVERSARLWLRAYPRRWRAAFGADLVGLLVEVGLPGARRVPAREAAAIVRAGWALRLREHPPLLRWLGYRLLDLRLPLWHQHWVADDLGGPLWFVRQNAVVLALVLVSAGHERLIGTHFLAILMGHAVVLGVLTLVWTTTSMGRSRRRASWERHVSPVVPQRFFARRDTAHGRYALPPEDDARSR